MWKLVSSLILIAHVLNLAAIASHDDNLVLLLPEGIETPNSHWCSHCADCWRRNTLSSTETTQKGTRILHNENH